MNAAFVIVLIALLIGAMGVALLRRRHEKGGGMPVAGVALCLVAVALGVVAGSRAMLG